MRAVRAPRVQPKCSLTGKRVGVWHVFLPYVRARGPGVRGPIALYSSVELWECNCLERGEAAVSRSLALFDAV